MAEVEKGKKKGRRAGVVTEHRSRRVIVYTNRNKPVVSDVAGAVPHFDDDDDDMALTPAHAQASAMLDGAVKHSTGNPVENAYAANRVSQPLTQGQQSPSTGDHGVGAGRPDGIAEHHPSLMQSTTTATPWFTASTVQGDNQYHDRDITDVAGQVGVSLLDLRAAASPMPDCLLPSANPASRRTDHISRDSATPPNGSHSLTDPQSHAAPSATKGAPVGGYAAMAMLRQVARDAVNGPG